MAQLVARLVRNEKVGGSNPPSSTTRMRLEPLPSSMVSVRASLPSPAQAGYRVIGVNGVRGVSRTGAALAVHHRVALGHHRPPERYASLLLSSVATLWSALILRPLRVWGWSPAPRWGGTPASRSRSPRSEPVAPAAHFDPCPTNTSTESSETTRSRVVSEDSVEVLRATTAVCQGAVRVLARVIVSPATAPCPRAGRRRPGVPESVAR